MTEKSKDCKIPYKVKKKVLYSCNDSNHIHLKILKSADIFPLEYSYKEALIIICTKS